MVMDDNQIFGDDHFVVYADDELQVEHLKLI